MENIVRIVVLGLGLDLATTSASGLRQGVCDRIAVVIELASIFGFLNEDLAALLVFLVKFVGDSVVSDVKNGREFCVFSLQTVSNSV